MEIHEIIRAGIEREYLRRGGTPDKWALAIRDPRLFNRAWNWSLRLPASDKPPPDAWRRVDPSTGRAAQGAA